jgi:hypothetical protein
VAGGFLSAGRISSTGWPSTTSVGVRQCFKATLVIAHDDGPEGKVFANVRAVLPLRQEGGRQ